MGNLQYSAKNIVVKVKGSKEGLNPPEVQVRNAFSGTVYVPDKTKYTATLAQIEFWSLHLRTTLVVDVFSSIGSTGKYTLTFLSK